jgi:hypothetical protein
MATHFDLPTSESESLIKCFGFSVFSKLYDNLITREPLGITKLSFMLSLSLLSINLLTLIGLFSEIIRLPLMMLLKV